MSSPWSGLYSGPATVAIDPSLNVFGKLTPHCFVTLKSSSGNGLLVSVGSPLPKCSVTPSGVVMLVTVLPLRSAAAIVLGMLGLRWRRGLAGGERTVAMSSSSLAPAR